jgi:hypothetical protein
MNLSNEKFKRVRSFALDHNLDSRILGYDGTLLLSQGVPSARKRYFRISRLTNEGIFVLAFQVGHRILSGRIFGIVLSVIYEDSDENGSKKIID